MGHPPTKNGLRLSRPEPLSAACALCCLTKPPSCLTQPMSRWLS